MAKKKFVGTATGSRLIQDDEEPPKAKAHPKDVNLPDEKAGKPVGKLGFADKSKDPLKQGYRDRLRKKPLDIEQEEQSRIIFGGDPDDPRWDDYRNDRKKKKR
jgi:hypothetical protein